ncbi:S8 family serine peptidase [Parahaliea aestuarii]|uniref:S8 family serine peptidase n=1 Tax=Parahaliea aestuarii TaxID=1852021 RepID=A0A5C8ZXC8_9GAMM|nr:S8 family serine peptidase [Parahaliea aestuarii]TXS93126.1 S8 family serine peptidase [Parahaliea aestuarii]
MSFSGTTKAWIKLPLAAAVTIASASAGASDLQLSGEQPTIVGSAPSTSESGKPEYRSEGGRSVYFVQLEDEPVATYNGGIKGLPATSNKATGKNKLDTRSKNSKAYRQYLKGKQDKFSAQAGIKGSVRKDYQVIFNGMAVEMTPEEADAMARMPGVKAVIRERHERPNTDAGAEWINADAIWPGPPNNVPHNQGEGLVIAVLDTGINSDHPSFADIGGDGYDHDNPLGSGNYIPGSYCDVSEPGFCNDKLIGAWSFVPEDPSYPSPEDSDGHGSHTASTAAGNVLTDATVHAPTTSLTRAISGVAPHANIIAYDVCIDTCPGSALLAAVEQVVEDAAALPDGIHALNYSISGGEDPYSDAVELGFLNAAAAGIYVSASAGNEGPGAATTGHHSPWIATTAASSHDRLLVNSLVGINAGNGRFPDITAVGFTSGYGPAPLIYAADFPTTNGSSNDTDPAQCLEPFPPGHFNGEIVICDRGEIARVDKGANVLAGGAGGMVLANVSFDGVVGDAHFLPAIHVEVDVGDALKTWLDSADEAVASITGYELSIDDANGDIMAGFSSRGPNNNLDILKPDVTAPGVSILAAIHTTSGGSPAEFGFISGTSMSSPHHAGAGAIVSGARPDWTPHMVKSAIMMTSLNSGIRKEDGVTPADAFDMGAGRVDLSRATEVDLVLDETTENFVAANPDLGGDPRTLNIPSMQDGACLGGCSWTRTFTNTARNTVHVDVAASSLGDAQFSVEPSRLKLKSGQSASIQVSADTRLASGWQFGQIDLQRRGDGPDLHLPIAAQAVTTSAPGVFSKTVDSDTAAPGDVLTYTIEIVNGQLSGQIDLSDSLPPGVSAIAGSETEVIVDGTTIAPFSVNGGMGSWSGTLAPGSLNVAASTTSPAGYLPLSAFGIAPFGCPSNCDDGAFVVDVPAFTYNGETYNQVIWSVNGTLEVGVSSGVASSFANQLFPDSTVPNNLLAPFWTDLNMGVDGDGAEWRVGVLSAGSTTFTVYEWENIPAFGDASQRYSFQIWVQNGSSGNIWFTYGQLGDTAGATVGAENFDGTIGSTYWFEGTGTAPAVGTDLEVVTTEGGSATFTFQAEVDSCDGPIVNSAEITTSDTSAGAIAVSRCTD